MNKAQAIYNFWSSFNLPAYDENTVPDDATFPYITYEYTDDDFGNNNPLRTSLWYRSNSWENITLKADQISESISRGGKMVNYNGGSAWIQKARPWSQRMSDPNDDTIRRIVLNVTIEYID